MAKAGGRTVNRSEIAEIFGVDVTTIDRWIRRGCPLQRRGGGGRPHEFNTKAVHEWHVDQAAGDEPAEGVISFEDARRDKMAAEAELARLDLEKRRGEIVELDVVAEIVESDYSIVRSRILGLASKVAPRVATCGSAARAQSIIEEEAREVLERLADGDGVAARANQRASEESGGKPSRRSAGTGA